MSSSTNTNSKLCKYCNQVQIYSNTTKKGYFEVENGNKHFCVTRKSTQSNTNTSQGTNRPIYYSVSGKPLTTQQQTKQQVTRHSNSIQILKGTEEQVQKQYETLADILAELGGRIHGSQSHYIETSGIDTNKRVKDGNGYWWKTRLDHELRIVVYYEVPTAEQRELVKQRFRIIEKKDNDNSL